MEIQLENKQQYNYDTETLYLVTLRLLKELKKEDTF